MLELLLPFVAAGDKVLGKIEILSLPFILPSPEENLKTF